MEHDGDQGEYDLDPGNVARFVVFGALGELLARFQVLELTFWGILAHRHKRGMTLDQRLARIEGWNRGVLGNLVAAADLPVDLDEEARLAVDARNYLVHRFMRDRMAFLHDTAFCEKVGTELAEVSRRLDDFETALSAYTRALGVPEVTEDELEELGLANLDPNEWFSKQSSPLNALNSPSATCPYQRPVPASTSSARTPSNTGTPATTSEKTTAKK